MTGTWNAGGIRAIAGMACAVLCVVSARADIFAGKVIAVSDGDTLTILNGRTPIKVRVSGIDAPEKAQPFGSKSKAGLSACAFAKQATVEWNKRDKYNRTVGKVLVNGTDCGLGQIRSGLAWHYKQFEREQAPEERDEYARAERTAAEAKIGLWADSDPIPPWEWRKATKKHSK